MTLSSLMHVAQEQLSLCEQGPSMLEGGCSLSTGTCHLVHSVHEKAATLGSLAGRGQRSCLRQWCSPCPSC